MKYETLQLAIARFKNGNPSPVDSGLFGASISPDEASVLILPAAFELTASCGKGTSQGPQAILEASRYLDFSDSAFEAPYRAGICMLEENNEIRAVEKETSALVNQIRENNSISQEQGHDQETLSQIDSACEKVNQIIHDEAQKWLSKGKFLGLVGGDHSCPYGFIKALSKIHKDGFSILHVDAHLDLRNAYEGFKFSHASIMYNVLNDIKEVEKIVSLGIRDFSEEEKLHSANLKSKSKVFYDRDIFRAKLSGVSFSQIVKQISADLGNKVYISFDIDGLDPSCCPSTGTPVPGGLSFNEAVYLIEEIAYQKTIVGFDLCEVGSSNPANDQIDLDADVGARILYKLCGSLIHSNKLVKK